MQTDAHDLDSLAACVEGRLNERETARLMAHLAECAECRATLAHMGRAVADGAIQRGAPLADSQRRWPKAPAWYALAASVLIATVAWFQFASPPLTPPSDSELLERRSAERIVAGKTFRMTSGEWIDTSLQAASGLPTIKVQGFEERAMLLARVPALADFAALGDRVVVVWEGKVYRFEP